MKIAFVILLLELLIFPLDLSWCPHYKMSKQTNFFWAQICLDEADNLWDNYECFLISIYLDVQLYKRHRNFAPKFTSTKYAVWSIIVRFVPSCSFYQMWFKNRNWRSMCKISGVGRNGWVTFKLFLKLSVHIAPILS